MANTNYHVEDLLVKVNQLNHHVKPLKEAQATKKALNSTSLLMEVLRPTEEQLNEANRLLDKQVSQAYTIVNDMLR